jgi:hypothetical protein
MAAVLRIDVESVRHEEEVSDEPTERTERCRGAPVERRCRNRDSYARDIEEKRQRPELSIITKTQCCRDVEDRRLDAGRR